ncbi:hypothetical protein [Sphingomonas sp. PP-CC-3A-396]|uniref:hypothetical protein n=1 Tax=Sphingomonas sp. PP-CC-3A-396 TaxID=2135655 RepID=UPI00104BCF0B|nr:hypothetical protein [Sphingomonas sp. PP-CC-3A-396]
MTDPLIDSLKTVPRTTKAARLRVLLPEIERLLSEGVLREDIIAHLKTGGLDLTLETFKTYLFRYRRDQRSAKTDSIKPTRSFEHERVADRKTVTDPEPMKEDDPDGDTIKPEPDSGAQPELRFADVFDRRKSDAYVDQFMTPRPLILGRNRHKP